MEQWYCLYTKPKSEYWVNVSLKNRGFETYLPLIASAHTNANLKKKPFFPCYMFFKADIQRTSVSILQWLPGLRHIIGFNGQPTPITVELIELIQTTVATLETGGDLPLHNFKQGDKVEITTGPFQGLIAIFDDPDNDSMRVKILLDILGQLSRVQIDVGALEKSPEEDEFTLNKQPRRTRGRGRYIKHKKH